MNKKLLITLGVCAVLLTGCNGYNVDIMDMNYKYTKAIIKISDTETKEIDVKSWRDYDDSDSVSITDTDGNTYYTHLSNVILIGGKEND